MTSIFEKILYGLKVANDNIVALDEKVNALMCSLTYEDTEPNEVAGAEEEVGDLDPEHNA